MKKSLIMLFIAAAALVFAGCASTSSCPKKPKSCKCATPEVCLQKQCPDACKADCAAAIKECNKAKKEAKKDAKKAADDTEKKAKKGAKKAKDAAK